MLLLKRHLVDLVRAGKTGQTVRLWSRALLRAGQISYTPGLGKMLITSVDQLSGLAALTEADAMADGFADLRGLLAEIRRIYGDRVPAGRSVFRIKFKWPVNDAGEVLEPPRREVVEPSRHHIVKSNIRPRKPGAAAGGMTKSQREKLRAFVVAQAPRR